MATGDDDDAAATAAPGHGVGVGRPGQDGGNKFQHAISAWRAVDLTRLVPDLDSTASEIVAYQRDSTIQRKELAQKTKDFRKLDDPSKLGEIKSLLKAYQTFIDLLTNHTKAVNSAFLKAYTPLSEAPDPYPLLEASVDSMLVTEDMLPKVTEENGHLQKTVAGLTNQLEETEARLQAERAGRQALEDGLESRVRDVEASWTAALDEKRDNWEAKEKALEEKVESQDRLLTEIKASYEVNQRLGRAGPSSGDDPDLDGHGHVASAELEMLHSDLDRTSGRLAEVEARNEQLRVELAQAKSQQQQQQQPQQQPHHHSAGSVEDDPAFMRVRSENSSLVRKLDAGRIEREALKRDMDTRLRGLDREVGLLREERDGLRTKVQRWGDYEELRRELEVLKSIEFSTGDDDEEDEEEDGSDRVGGVAGRGGGGGDTLEKLLVSRNKKLSDELTVLRVSHQDLQSRLEAVQAELARASTELDKARSLNDKLESDLATVQSEGGGAGAGGAAFPSGASVAGTYVSRYAPSMAPTSTRRGRISPTSSIISGINPRGSYADGGDPGVGSPSMLPMITAQRDRFKKRITQLELELSEAHRTVSQLRQEVAALQRDNLNLYEKTRYVSTFNRGGGGGPSAATSSSSAAAYPLSNPNPSAISIGGDGGGGGMSGAGSPALSLDRYRRAYESNLSPFAAFRGRESARAYRRMSLPERAVYSVTRMVLASRTSRNLFAAYCLGLHLIVLMALYRMGSRGVVDGGHLATSRAVGMTAAAAAGMAGGGGGGDRAGGSWRQEDGLPG